MSIEWSFRLERDCSSFARFFPPVHGMYKLGNSGAATGYVCLGQELCQGRILALKLSRKSIICVTDYFLCSSSELTLNCNMFLTINQVLRLPINNIIVKADQLEGTLFLQSGGEIMKKILREGDAMYLNIQNLVALEQTCTLLPMNHTRITNSVFKLGIYALHIKGPGIVYFCHHPVTKFKNSMKLSWISSQHFNIFHIVLMSATLFYMILLVLVFFDVSIAFLNI